MSVRTVYVCDWCGKESEEASDVQKRWFSIDWNELLVCPSCGAERTRVLAEARERCRLSRESRS